MKVVVFGGAGFVGSHVADKLSEEGFDVVIYDKKHSPYLSRNQQMVVGDILDVDKVNMVVEGATYVYNFAGIANLKEAAENPIKTTEVNVLGNTNVLEACRLHQVKRFVFASTLYVYGSFGSFYRASKQACELMIESYFERYNVNYTVLRYGSLYGPRADKNNFIYRILRQALEEKKITREGDGKELREYIHVLDASHMSVKILADEFKNQHVIITGQQDMKVEDLMVMIKEMFNNEIELEFLEGTDDTHYEITPINFRPKLAKRIFESSYVDLGQGLLEMLHQLQENKEIIHEKEGMLPIGRIAQ